MGKEVLIQVRKRQVKAKLLRKIKLLNNTEGVNSESSLYTFNRSR